MDQYVYFHGQPGSPDELRLVAPGDWELEADLFVPDRAQDHRELPFDAYLDYLAASVARRFPTGPIRIVGFSLGGFVAMEVALRLADEGRGRDLSLDLISAAAPLDYGDFLPQMAGGLVFSLARTRPAAFALLTRVQGVLAWLAPGLLVSQVFADAAGADAELARRPAFQATLRGILAHSLARGGPGYRREILGYVSQPPDRLAALTTPITLWQGEADTWTPPAMARALAEARPDHRTVRSLPGLSHYSTLQAALPQILGRGV